MVFCLVIDNAGDGSSVLIAVTFMNYQNEIIKYSKNIFQEVSIEILGILLGSGPNDKMSL